MQPLKAQVQTTLFKIKSWKMDEVFQQVERVGELEIFLSGIQANNPRLGSVTGSAAHSDDYPIDQAWYELVERISILESMKNQNFLLRNPDSAIPAGIVAREIVFPSPGVVERDGANLTLFQYAKSNGVALFTSWSEACRRACLELVERHLVLASWVGMTTPQTFSSRSSRLDKLANIYEVVGISFGSQRVLCSEQQIFVSGYMLLPKSPSNPLVIGFGAGFTPEESLVKAESETIQRLGFLWGVEVSSQDPEFQASHLYHQDYYLNPAKRKVLEDWIAGRHMKLEGFDRPATLKIDFADLSSQRRPELFIAKALSAEAIPLVFGKWREREFGKIPEELLIHPIA